MIDSNFHLFFAERLHSLIAAHVLRMGRSDGQAQQKLMKAHADAARGAPLTEAVWYSCLAPAWREIFEHAYPGDAGYAAARASGADYAAANARMIEKYFASADAYAHQYADGSVSAAKTIASIASGHAHGRCLAAIYCGRNTDYAASWPIIRIRALRAILGDALSAADYEIIQGSNNGSVST